MKIDTKDNIQRVIVKLSDGNPGALSVLIQIIKNGNIIDPDSLNTDEMNLFLIDELEIYGPNLWILYKDVCQQNLLSLFSLFRAYELKIITKVKIHDFITNQSLDDFNIDNLLEQVRQTIPNFGKDYENEQ